MLYCVVREAVNKAVRHSSASRITVDLVFDGGLGFRVTDDGYGFDIVSAMQQSGYFALAFMRERLATYGGATLRVES